MRSLLLVALAFSSPAAAQVTWEPIGFEGEQASALAFRHGADGAPDTLYTSYRAAVVGGIHRWEADGTWTRLHEREGDEMETLLDGTLLIHRGTVFLRSPDGGRTWSAPQSIDPNACRSMMNAHESALPPPIGTPDGERPMLYIARGEVCRSDDGAATLDFMTPETDVCGDGRPGSDAAIRDLTDLPPSAAFPDGRLIYAAYNGMGYSADGDIYACSSFWEPFRWGVEEVEVHADPAHPYGGTVYAVMRDFWEGFPAVYASEDGGETYEKRRLFGRGSELEYPQGLTAEMAASGAMVVGMDGGDVLPDGTIVDDVGLVLWSGDGGRTWTDLTPEASGWGGHGVLDIEIGRDGRIYAATRGGVWRTTSAVSLPVANEPATPEASGARLRVSPNPSSGAMRVEITAPTPEAVEVIIVDARGREVARVASGAQGPVEVSTAGWAPGVYVARATVGGERVSARFTVVE